MESVVASSLLLLLLMLLLQSLAAFRLPESTPMRPSGWGRGRGRGMAPAAASAHGQYQHQQEPEPEEPNSRIRYCSPSTASSRQEYILNKMAAALVVGSVSFLGLSGAGSASAGDVGVEGSSPLLVAAVKASSLAEAQAAARNVKDCLQGVKDMQTAANEGDWATVR